MKLIHEKFRGTKKLDQAREFHQEFEEAIKYNPEIKQHLNKVQEDLTPITVSRIFERIPSEDVELLCMDPVIGRPERLLLSDIFFLSIFW